MSTEYYFYLGYRDNNTEKIHALGPYDNTGKLKPFYYCSSAISDVFYDYYNKANIKELDESIIEDFASEDKEESYCYYINIDECADTNFCKSGYFLIDDVERYKSEGSYILDEIFYEKLDPLVYAEKLKNERMFGPPKTITDCEGNDITPRSMSEFMYFCYPDFQSIEYINHLGLELIDNFLWKFDADKKNMSRLILCYKSW